jgi:hypothetical protein
VPAVRGRVRLHPIFRLHDPRTTVVAERKRGGGIYAIKADGRLICEPHGKPMRYATAVVADRSGLCPGQPSRESDFRVRGNCAHGCGKPGLGMKHDWSKLTFYPHHPDGHPKRYAHRKAMLARISQVESFFHHVKGGLKLANSGAARTRVIDKDTVEALLSLAALSTTAPSSPTSACTARCSPRASAAPPTRSTAAASAAPAPHRTGWRPTLGSRLAAD